jgi:hypothetical protein
MANENPNKPAQPPNRMAPATRADQQAAASAGPHVLRLKGPKGINALQFVVGKAGIAVPVGGELTVTAAQHEAIMQQQLPKGFSWADAPAEQPTDQESSSGS